MNAATQRKGATRAADIPADVLHALSHGELQSATLAEGLALDQARLLRTVFPQLSRHTVQRTDAACQFGILKRMAGIGAALLEELGNDGITQCQGHASDTVRGWACFMIGSQAGLSLPRRLAAIRPLADDAHFGVREWAWMAIRPHLAEDLDDAIAHLTKWTTEPSERLRRFASEALRPRGVWCAHIAAFKQQPERALPVLSPLRADLSVYVQDSVANWLNDAGKDRPDWVRELCAQWLQGHPTAATHRICQRALRNLK
ncbi:MAG: HEAT repeat domain-containing protein [Comamonas sp.]|uniref:HEAT repeat domain-containing protein n=1 Tax=Comamonas resistens TaxID=3046670 RepID=A0ABY8SSD3_9BURK|nr:HEAT repeat domain-containing protein [Comamonas resistens]MDD3018743.1 HEAT repeat domain-containing protein [Comamonas sp.]MDL5038750.1 HEAT repeat domain-containing protein [Comamonas resistens]WHS64191.1 HEAT repeat domain-containing protein [Comamonas resistens]